MKPFDLEAAKRGEPITTRDGRCVRFLAHVPEAGEDARIVAMVEGDNRPRLFRESGICNLNAEGSGLDLAMRPRVVWVNFYANGTAVWYESREVAEREAETPSAFPLHTAVRVEV